MALPYRMIDAALKELGPERTKAVGRAARKHDDALGQADWLALFLRETLCKNIESRGRDDHGKPSDTGIAQINRYFNEEALKVMPAVKAGTWEPVVPRRSPYNTGYCPTLQATLGWVDRRLYLVQRQAALDHVRPRDMKHFTFTSHNAGYAGALKGYKEGHVDRYTTGGEYGEWCVATARRVKRWLLVHPRYKA